MKTKEELTMLSNAIGKAQTAYRQAILDNLKESGKEHDVKSDWDEEKDDNGVHLSYIGRHGETTLLIDKVRFSKAKAGFGYIDAHIAAEDGNGCDYWMMGSEFGNDADYIYDNIIW